MHRRNSKVEENAVYCCDSAAIEDVVEIAEVGMNEGKMRIEIAEANSAAARIGIKAINRPRRQSRENRA